MIARVFDDNDEITVPTKNEEPLMDNGDLDDFIFRGEPVITHSDR